MSPDSLQLTPSAEAEGVNRSVARIAFRLFATVAAIYALTLPVNHSEAEDALEYVWRVEQPGWAAAAGGLHPGYLLPARVLWIAARGVAPDLRAAPLLIAVSLLAGAWVVAQVFLSSARTLLLRLPVALAAALAVAFSYGFWRYSQEVEVYTLALALLLPAWRLAAASSGGAGKSLACGLLAGGAVALHSVHVLPVFGVFPLFWARGRRWRRPRPQR